MSIMIDERLRNAGSNGNMERRDTGEGGTEVSSAVVDVSCMTVDGRSNDQD